MIIHPTPTEIIVPTIGKTSTADPADEWHQVSGKKQHKTAAQNASSTPPASNNSQHNNKRSTGDGSPSGSQASRISGASSGRRSTNSGRSSPSGRGRGRGMRDGGSRSGPARGGRGGRTDRPFNTPSVSRPTSPMVAERSLPHPSTTKTRPTGSPPKSIAKTARITNSPQVASTATTPSATNPSPTTRTEETASPQDIDRSSAAPPDSNRQLSALTGRSDATLPPTYTADARNMQEDLFNLSGTKRSLTDADNPTDSTAIPQCDEDASTTRSPTHLATGHQASSPESTTRPSWSPPSRGPNSQDPPDQPDQCALESASGSSESTTNLVRRLRAPEELARRLHSAVPSPAPETDLIQSSGDDTDDENSGHKKPGLGLKSLLLLARQ
ncbi:hypothetical protein ACA910_007225 [Epithemia clementina (nom. ined.)]